MEMINTKPLFMKTIFIMKIIIRIEWVQKWL